MVWYYNINVSTDIITFFLYCSSCEKRKERMDNYFMMCLYFRYESLQWLFCSWRMVSSGMLWRVALVRTDVSEEHGATFIRVTRIGELGTTQAATSNRCTLWRNGISLQSHGVTSQNTPFFIVTTVKTSNLTYSVLINVNMQFSLITNCICVPSNPMSWNISKTLLCDKEKKTFLISSSNH
jgi:hypothetical protein